ncbi:DUF488 domain-containing protein [Brucella sp. NBRC 12950]|jgi:uncharacterized protein YeaO (DUF488 family)|uniref:DUF488 domain-containing protein n=1 Tax=Brucella sp. NBRC 12950 TaxID=2994518 RepID=UPI0024A2E974|nr:DUF488 domain-containing protein [Brucella sp. NBRC 12950]GLU25803.1 hypothetical protein Brsp01_10360 [Brucella sp. NBRC 12950]
MPDIEIKRIYDEPQPNDGFRILADRVWPRGMTKEKAAIDLWAKDLAPSTELRKWFDHDIAKWPEFQEKYRDELKANQAEIQEALTKASGARLTLLFGAKDVEHNQAVVLRDFLMEQS